MYLKQLFCGIHLQVGDREDSNVYIRMKMKAAEEVGMSARHIRLPNTLSQDEVNIYSCTKLIRSLRNKGH